MELTKVKILLENSIDRNYNSNTYGTLTATSFYVNVMLTSDIKNIGLFSDTPSVSNKNISDYFSKNNQIITAITDSRLNEVKTYNNETPLLVNFNVNEKEYLNYEGNLIYGVDRVTDTNNPITYTFDTDNFDINIGTEQQKSGILYRDFTGSTNETNISYTSEGINETNSSLSGIIMEEYLIGIISKPEIKNDIFINRGNISVFEKHLKLSEVTNIRELKRYGGGIFNLNGQ